MISLRTGALLACGALMMAGCGSAERDWSRADTDNTVSGYQTFLSEHESSQHADEARQRLAALQDDQDWHTADTANSVDSYQEYLYEHPGGRQSALGRSRLSALERADAWKSADKEGTVEALRAFLQQYPQGPEADRAHQKLAELTGYRVQLVAMHNMQSAERKREQLQSRFGNVLSEITVLGPDAKQTTYRVSSGIMSESDAGKACTTLKHDKQQCKVVKADPAA